MIEKKELEQGRPEALFDEQLQRKKQEKQIEEGEAPAAPLQGRPRKSGPRTRR